MEFNEKELVSRSKAGDNRAFEELVKRYQRKVFGIAYGIVRDPEGASDVCQETFLRAFKSLSKFKGDSKFYTWIYRIAVNMSIDYVNKHKKDPVLFNDDTNMLEKIDWDVSTSKPINPIKSLDVKELGTLINNGLQKLSENHRAVIILREVEGLSYNEIADVLKCNKGTVMSRLFHARSKMKTMLQAYLDGEETK